MAIEQSMKDSSYHVDIGSSNRKLWSFVVGEYRSDFICCINFTNNLAEVPDHSISKARYAFNEFFPIVGWIQHIEHKHHEEHNKLKHKDNFRQTSFPIQLFLINIHIHNRCHDNIDNLSKDAFFHERDNWLGFRILILEANKPWER